jgi:hypothetical protein
MTRAEPDQKFNIRVEQGETAAIPLQRLLLATSDSQVDSAAASVSRTEQLSDQENYEYIARGKQPPSHAEFSPRRLRLLGKFICSFCITTRADI